MGEYKAEFEIEQQNIEAEFDVSQSVCEATFEIGITGEGDKHYTHYQDVPAAKWTVNHGLEKHPSVTIVTSAGDQVIADVEYVSNNTCILRFTSEFSGRAYFN